MAGKVIIEASAKHTATVIFFHGLGDTGHGWASSLAEIKPAFVKLVCPTAPTIPVTLNSGFRMPAWFDLKGLDLSAGEDTEGIQRAAASVHGLIEDEIKGGIPSNRIIIGGFSQGGALSLYSSLVTQHTLGGVVALSCWLPLRDSFPAKIVGNTETPILMCHGDSDPIVPHRWGEQSAALFKKFNKSVEFRTYRNLAHSSSDEEMRDVKAFIMRNLA
ncbi:hypothetical protein GHT06_012918 [Daphnia sinensis]|uniref:palmitoyl-protein hydrolase n=1 Tax=Daphnia sinensis TaxID=1820382 RepID=A0AAD5LFV4_9CRUS|nr:hypothetical protein GHT06_012918 [Daphnia sinensis]